MSTPSWMLVRMMLETASFHARADADRLAGLDITTVAQYRTLLSRIYGFEAPVEAALARVSDLQGPLLDDRAKTARLRADLISLGVTPGELATLSTARIPELRTVPQALGWMFVVERQTLLAGHLRRHLARVLPDAIQIASSYLAAYGEHTGARLRELGEALATAAEHYAPRALTNGAAEAFRTQRLWYSAAHDPRRRDGTPADALEPRPRS